MNIAVIGYGSVGGALCNGLSKAGHKIFLGVRDTNKEEVKALLSENVSANRVKEAVEKAEVVIIAVKANAAKDVADNLADVSEKIIIDAMNSWTDLSPFKTTAEALLSWTNCKDIVKCFNTTGANNMANPEFGEQKADMFVAGDSVKGKQIAEQLAKDVGFGEVYDLGGADKFVLIEQLASVWVSLAMGGYGRNIAFKILRK